MPTPTILLRNIAIIAHVDHGKTTLVDGFIKQTSHIRGIDEMKDLIMDNNDQERERGITIKAKNASIYWDFKNGNDQIPNGLYKINIVDTPGHADFGGEVERTLRMVDAAVLLVDAQEGPMPQTKFVLKKALELGLKVILVVNKVDKPAANCPRTVDKVENLFLDLSASDDQMDFPVIYASGVLGKAGRDPANLDENLAYLLDQIILQTPSPDQTQTRPILENIKNKWLAELLS
jgi:GTP-binding protein